MPIIGAFMVPHPPLIIPSIGKGEEKKVQKTIDAYYKVAKKIKELKPDTIIITSPHSPSYIDFFHISDGNKASGNFNNFNSSEEISVTYDVELRNKIIEIAKEELFPAGTEGERDSELDHGTMVPIYFINKEYQDYQCLRIGITDLPLRDHYQLGKIIQKATDILNKKVLIVASGDLSHKLQEYGPYGYIEEGPIYDKKIMNTMQNADFKELIEYDNKFLEKAAVCGHQSFSIMAGTLDKKEVETKIYSHEDITGVGYGIAYFKPIGENDNRCFLEPTDPYVKLAKLTIDNYIKNGIKIEIPNNTPKELLVEKRGVFVSIHEHGELRGCIGTFKPTKNNKAEEIIDNAILASTKDYRFKPIIKEELNNLEVNVDVLSDTEIVNNIDELDPKKYGIIVTKGYQKGLLLPDIEGINTVEEQINIAKQKGNIIGEDYIIEKFTVERHK